MDGILEARARYIDAGDIEFGDVPAASEVVADDAYAGMARRSERPPQGGLDGRSLVARRFQPKTRSRRL